MTKVQEVKSYDSHLAIVMSPGSFNVNFYSYMTHLADLFLDESSTSTHFEVLYYSEDRQMTSSESIFLCFHYCELIVRGSIFSAVRKNI